MFGRPWIPLETYLRLLFLNTGIGLGCNFASSGGDEETRFELRMN